MKTILRFITCLIVALPLQVFAQTVFTNVQVNGTLQVGTVPLTTDASSTSFYAGTGISATSSAGAYVLGPNHILSESPGAIIMGSENNLETAPTTSCGGFFNTMTNVDLCSVYGIYNNLTATYSLNTGPSDKVVEGSSIYGTSNTMNNAGFSSCLGFNNIINCDGISNFIFAFGNGLNINPNDGFGGLLVLGFNNGALALDPNDGADSPFFVIANGFQGTPSNALVMQQTGRTTLLHTGYLEPTTGTPNPVEPEVLVIKGTATIDGQLNLTRRQGDIWMGSFGRTEDQGPSN